MRLIFSKLLALAVVAIGVAAPAQAVAAVPTSFSGPYALSNWQTTNDGNTGGTTVDISNPTTLTFNGGDLGCLVANTCLVHFSIFAAGKGTISFDWNFSTNDLDSSGLQTFEQFGYGVNGNLTELTSSNVSPASGTVVVTEEVNVGDTFEFFYDCRDCDFGPGTASVTGFMAPVPEPETWALMLVGVGLIGSIARRRLAK